MESDQPTAQRFPFAFAALGFPSADGCSAAPQSAPPDWVQRFTEGQLTSSAVCLPLLQSCKDGLGLVLQGARSVAHTIDLSLAASALTRRTQCVSQHVQRRLPRPSAVRLTAAPVEGGSVQQGVQVFSISPEAAAGIPQLFIGTSVSADHPVLPHALRSLNHVTHLTLDAPLSDGWVALLTNHLPRLSQLTVQGVSIHADPNVTRTCQWTRLIVQKAPSKLVCAQLLSGAPLPSGNRALHIELTDGTELAFFAFPIVSRILTHTQLHNVPSTQPVCLCFSTARHGRLPL